MTDEDKWGSRPGTRWDDGIMDFMGLHGIDDRKLDQDKWDSELDGFDGLRTTEHGDNG